jgi:uncharacterized protein (DUF1800 family)
MRRVPAAEESPTSSPPNSGARLALLGVLALAPPLHAAESAPGALSARDSALHVLERFAYGPLPGQVERVAQEGALAWLEAQLGRDGRDPALAAREAGYEALTLDSEDWARRFAAVRRAVRERRAAARDSMMAVSRDAPDAASTTEPGTVPGTRALRGDRPPRIPEMMEARHLLDQVRGLAVLRAVTSDAQVREVMADFWFNHFNVFLGKGADRFLLPTYVEQVIRPHALGRFRDLLIATAHSPALLFYLDNVQSVAPADARANPGLPAANPRRRGINENYARELLELHTLGVDGGYTQHDVIEVARILTGWSMEPPDRGGGFVFRPRVHDYGEKTVLGVRFPAGHGEDEGLRLLEMLARHPATIRHVCRKLCARFVSDDPPDGCVDLAVAAWERSDGDVREVLRAIARAPEFWSAAARGSKVKTPLEFVVSAARAVRADPDATPGLANAAARLGQPLYMQPSPAGYPERQEEWVNSGALLGRMNFAVALAAGRQPGAAVDLDAVVPADGDSGALVDAVNDRVLGGAMTANTRRVILEEIADLPDGRDARALAVGLALGSPEFQKQ